MRLVLSILVALTIAVVLTVLFAIPIQFLWNGVLVSAVTWAREITLLETCGLFFLVRLLFFSFTTETKK